MADPAFEREYKQALLRQLGAVDGPPLVQFFDHYQPLNNTEGRPRFRDATYIAFRQLDSQDEFHRVMEESDKFEFPNEWNLYCERRELVARRVPPLQAIVGLTPASYQELLALEITNCEQLANYEGDLDELEILREYAARIMEIDNEIRARREGLGEGLERSVHSDGEGNDSGSGGSAGGGGNSDRTGTGAKKRGRKSSKKRAKKVSACANGPDNLAPGRDREKTISYSFNVGT